MSPIDVNRLTLLFATVLAVLLGPTPGEARADDAESLRKKIGRTIVVGFRGLDVEPDSPIVRQIRKGYVGGVILFDHDVPTGSDTRNVRSPDQVQDLIHDLQSLTDRDLIVGVDQEGGLIQRLSPENGFDSYPSHEELGTHDDTAQTDRVASRMAGSLRDLGFNVNFAPVVDLNLNPDNPVIGGLQRSFGAAPELVTRHARQFVKAHREENVAAVLKHFPGHGSSRKDSHKGFVDVTDVWERKERVPYRRLLNGKPVPAVMTAHLYNRRWDTTWPATLSSKVIGGTLRGELDYAGVVFSDDLQMGALRKRYDRRTVLERTLKAGVDVLIFANNSVYEPEAAPRAVRSIRDLIRRGVIDRETIEKSNRRIRRMLRAVEER